MSNIKCIWGGATGKVIATLLVLGIVCGAMFFSLHHALKGEVLLTTDEVSINSSSDDGNNSLDVKLSVKKAGFYLSGVKTEKEGDKLCVKFYASVEKSADFAFDSQGYYNIKLPFDEKIKTVVQKGADDDEVTILTLNHKS